MTEAPEQSRPGSLRKRLVVLSLFAIAVAFFVASFLVRR